MGRFYSGCINGKYWVAVQSSGCMEDYGASNKGSDVTHKECGCQAVTENGDECIAYENYDNIPDKVYCKDCYSSYEEHIKDCDDEDDDTYYIDESTNYCMTQDDFEQHAEPFIRENQSLWDEYIEKFEIIDDFEYDVDLKNNPDSNKLKILADLCMLNQIKEYFKKTNSYSCEWNGEN